MKKYRLLKDLPFAKAGKILELWSDGTMAFKDNPSLPRFRKSDVERFPLWFERLDEPKFYYLIDSIGDVREATEEEVERLEKRKAIGNYFRTREEAEKHLEWLKARAVLREDTKGFKANGFNNYRGWQVYYSASWNKFDINSPCLAANIYNDISFETKEDAEESIKNHTKEWKIYLGIE